MLKHSILGMLLAMVTATSAHAQPVVGPKRGGVTPAPMVQARFLVGPTRGGVVSSSGVALNNQSKRLTIGATSNWTSFYRYGLVGPTGFGGFRGYGSAGPFFGPGCLYGPPGINIVVQPIVVPQPIIIPVRAEGLTDLSQVPDLGRFKIIRPDNLNIPVIPPPERVVKKPKEIDLGIKPAELPLARPRAANALIEAERQIDLGKAAFSEGQYGRSIEHFRKATAASPEQASAYFLLAQARFAVGKYDEAVTSIADGLKRQPDWPASKFSSRELYRADPAPYEEHLRNLRAALAVDPDNPLLLFLLGVQLWFDGQREVAKPLIEKAAKLSKDPGPVLAFSKIK